MKSIHAVRVHFDPSCWKECRCEDMAPFYSGPLIGSQGVSGGGEEGGCRSRLSCLMSHGVCYHKLWGVCKCVCMSEFVAPQELQR